MVSNQTSGFRASKLWTRPTRQRYLCHACAGVAAEQSMRRTRGQPEIPRHQVPRDGPDQSGQDHVRRNDVHVDAFDDRLRDLSAESKCGREVEERGPHHGLARRQNPRRYDCRYRVGSIMETVDVIECERDRDDDDDEEESRIHAGWTSCF